MVLKLRERQQHKKKERERGLSWWSSGKNPPSKAGNAGSVPGQGTKSPHDSGQLATEPECLNWREAGELQGKVSDATPKTRCK